MNAKEFLPQPITRPSPSHDEERRVGRRVVVVEQFEQEREAALRAALALAREADVAVELARAVAAVGADEGVGHAWTQTTKAAGSRRDRDAPDSSQRRYAAQNSAAERAGAAEPEVGEGARGRRPARAACA